MAASADVELAELVQQRFSTDRFRIYTNKDVLGVELAGALKNVLAIAAGICDGLEFGDNALPYAKIQIKLAESMRIRAVARTADGKNHVAFRDIKVTLSGC